MQSNDRQGGMVRTVQIVGWGLLGIAIFVPRYVDILTVINPDGCYAWLERSAAFYAALAAGDFAGTYQSPHPGVLVMILAGAGLIVGSIIEYGTISPWEHIYDLAVYAHLPLTFLTGGLILASYPLSLTWTHSRRLSFSLVLFLAISPVLLTHSRYLHLDATAALLSVVALFAALSFNASHNRTYLVLAAILLGGAITTRSSAIIAAPIIALVCADAFRTGLRIDWRSMLTAGSVGVITTATTCMLLWPALWVDPIGVVTRVFGGIGSAVTQSHENLVTAPGNTMFVAENIITRNSLWSWLLFMTSAAHIGYRLIRRQQLSKPEIGILWILVYGLVVLALISNSQKAQTIDNGYRYALGSFIAFQCVAAYGFFVLLDHCGRRIGSRHYKGVAILPLGFIALVIYESFRVFSAHPYYASAYNELIEPHKIGWGEGLDQVGEYLSGYENSGQLSVASFYPCVLRQHFNGRVISMREFVAETDVSPDFVVLYGARDSEERFRAIFEAYRDNPDIPPIFVARIRGRDYAWVYALKRKTIRETN